MAAWFITWLENFRDWLLSGVFREMMGDFLPWLVVVFAAYFAKNVLKRGWEKLKAWGKRASLKTKLIVIGIIVPVFVCVCLLVRLGARMAVEYIKPVQYINTEVSFYAGEEDVSFNNVAELNFPEHMDAEGIDVAYVWDSGKIHELWPSWEKTYGVGGYVADALHVRNGALYALTAPWRDDSAYADSEHYDYRFTLLRVWGEERNIPAEGVTDIMDEPFHAGTDWLEMRFTDFLFSNNGDTLWLARQDVGRGTVILERIPRRVADKDEFFIEDLEWFADLQFNVTDNNKPRLAMDGKGNLYISAPEDHEILRFDFEHEEDRFKIFAGDEQEEGSHRDGPNPRFVKPTSIAVKGDYLYIYDSGTLRRVSLSSGKCVTMAGRLLPDGEGDAPVPNAKQTRVSGAEAILPCGQYPGMAVFDNGTVLLCNRESGVIYRIEERNDS